MDIVEKLRSQIGDDVQHMFDHEALFRIAADEIVRLRAAPSAPRVRALVWTKWGEANGGGAKYSAYETYPGKWNCTVYPHEAEMYRIAEGVTIEAARAAAQADFTARIYAELVMGEAE